MTDLNGCYHIDTSNERGIHYLIRQPHCSGLLTQRVFHSHNVHQRTPKTCHWKTLEISRHMKLLLKQSLRNETADVEMPDHWTLEFTQECHYMVHVLVNAARNPGRYLYWLLNAMLVVMKAFRQCPRLGRQWTMQRHYEEKVLGVLGSRRTWKIRWKSSSHRWQGTTKNSSPALSWIMRGEFLCGIFQAF